MMWVWIGSEPGHLGDVEYVMAWNGLLRLADRMAWFALSCIPLPEVAELTGEGGESLNLFTGSDLN